MKVLVLLGSSMALAGCTVQYFGNRYEAAMVQPEWVCIVDNPEVRAEFMEKLVPLLKARQIATRSLPAGSSTDSCPYVLTYAATWHWDLVPYMRSASMFLFKSGKLFSDSGYLAPHALVNMSLEALEKTEVKLEGMLNRMGLVARP